MKRFLYALRYCLWFIAHFGYDGRPHRFKAALRRYDERQK